MDSRLTNEEKRKIELLFSHLDTDKRGYIDEESAKGSQKMLDLVKSLRRNSTGSSRGRIYLPNLMEYYEKFKAEQSQCARAVGKESICDRFVTRTMKRVEAYKQRASYGTLNVPVISKC